MTGTGATLIVLRHGNTFEAGESSRYVGARTDLALTATGQQQAVDAGLRLLAQNLVPVKAYTSPMLRTRQTAMGALSAFDKVPLVPDVRLREADYGPDEDKPDAEVKARIGDQLESWNSDAVLPDGWSLDIANVRAVYQKAAAEAIAAQAPVLLVTHGGIARFVRDLLPDPAVLAREHSLKLGTGKLAILAHVNGVWTVKGWNV